MMGLETVSIRAHSCLSRFKPLPLVHAIEQHKKLEMALNPSVLEVVPWRKYSLCIDGHSSSVNKADTIHKCTSASLCSDVFRYRFLLHLICVKHTYTIYWYARYFYFLFGYHYCIMSMFLCRCCSLQGR